MGRRSLTRMRRDEAGFALIEVLISAVLLLIVAAGVFLAFDASTRATAQERHRARANDLAQSDLERIRSLPYACPLASPSCTYSIVSLITPESTDRRLRTEPLTRSSPGAVPDRDADDERLRHRSGFPRLPADQLGGHLAGHGTRPPVTAASAVSPPSGSVVPNTGSLLVNVTDSHRRRDPRRRAIRQRPGLLQWHDRIERLRALAEPAGGQLHDAGFRGAPRQGRQGRQSAQRAAAANHQRGRPGDQHGQSAVRHARFDQQHEPDPVRDQATMAPSPSPRRGFEGRFSDPLQHRHDGGQAARDTGYAGIGALGERAIPVRLAVLRLRRYLSGG